MNNSQGLFPYCDHPEIYNATVYPIDYPPLICSSTTLTIVYISIVILYFLNNIIQIALLIYLNFNAWTVNKTFISKTFCISWTIGILCLMFSYNDPASLIFNRIPILARDVLFLGAFPFFFGGLFLLTSTLIEVIVSGNKVLEAKLRVPKIISLVIVIVLFVLSVFLMIIAFQNSIYFVQQIISIIYSVLTIVFVIGLIIITWRLESVDVDKSKKGLYLRMKVACVIEVSSLVLEFVAIIPKLNSSPDVATYMICNVVGNYGISIFSISFIFLLFPSQYYSRIFCCFKNQLS